MNSVDVKTPETLPDIKIAPVPDSAPANKVAADTATQLLDEYLERQQHAAQARLAELQLQQAIITRQLAQQVRQLQKAAEEQLQEIESEIVRARQHLTELEGLQKARKAHTTPS